MFEHKTCVPMIPSSPRSFATARNVCITLAVFVFAACENSTNPPSDAFYYSSYGIIPLRAGNSWTILRFDASDSLGAFRPGDTSRITIPTVAVYANQPWFIAHWGDWAGGGNAYSNSIQGCLVRGWYHYPTFRFTEQFLRYKYPATAGDQYAVPGVFHSADTAWVQDSMQICTVLSTDTVITVPAGTFHCYHYRFQWTYHSTHPGIPFEDEFLSPGVGRVQWDQYDWRLVWRPFRYGSIVLTAWHVT